MIRGWLVCAALVACGAAYGAGTVFAQDERATVLAVAREVEDEGEQAVKLDVTVRDVTDLGAFVFILTFKGDLLEVKRIERGEFLGSTDREVTCLEPTIDANALRYTCVTLGDTPREGAEGEGRLATVFFSIKGEGESNIQFSRAQLTTPPGEPIDTEWQAGVIEIQGDGGMGWVLYAIIGGVVITGVVVLAAVLALVSRRRGAAGGSIASAEGE
jgi:hypothetical protein